MKYSIVFFFVIISLIGLFNFVFASIQITINNPLNDSVHSDLFNVTFNITANWSAYSLNGGANVSMGAVSTYDTYLYGLSDGYNYITVYANDSAGLMNSSSRGWTKGNRGYSTTVTHGGTGTPFFYPNQRAICRTDNGDLHIAWRAETFDMVYANSSDNGVTWSPVTLYAGFVTKTPGIDCHGTNVTIAFEVSSTIFLSRSTDGGASWTTGTTGIGSTIEDIMIHERGSVLYMAHWNSGNTINLMNSTDGGLNWSTPVAIMTPDFKYPTFAVDGNGTGTDKLYVFGMNDTDKSKYFRKSTDAGATWGDYIKVFDNDSVGGNTNLGNGAVVYDGDTISVVAGCVGNDTVLFSQSIDAGATWIEQLEVSSQPSTNKSSSPVITTNAENGNIFVFWMTNQYHSSWDVQYRRLSHGNWGNIVNLTDDGDANGFPKVPESFSDGKLDMIYEYGGGPDYRNVLYTYLLDYTEVNNCSEMDVANMEYRMIADIDGATLKKCMNISAENVTFDCKDYNLKGINSTNYGVYSNHNSTTVKNCNLYWFEDSIHFFDSFNGLITNISSIDSEFGIYLSGASNYTVSNVNVTSNHTIQYGIAIYLGDDNEIYDSNFYLLSFGIWLYGAEGNIFHDNNVYDNSYGVDLGLLGDNNLFYNNLFNQTNNTNFDLVVTTHDWNTTEQVGTRVHSGGVYIGGNYYTNSTGDDYSDTCTDSDEDGFCDSSYELATGNIDYLPMSDGVSPIPNYADNSTNSTYADSDILHNITVSDDTGLATTGGYIFSYDNGTGTFTNYSWVAFASNPETIHIMKHSNTSTGATIRWKIYANDTSDNWGESSTYSYVTTTAAAVSYVWCYQETANVSTACGGLNTGSYNGTILGSDSWTLAFDGDWNTNAYNIQLFVNYTKPANSTSSSLWLIKDTYAGADNTNNVSISQCWDGYVDKIVLKGITTGGGLDYYAKYYCHDGSSWIEVLSNYVAALRNEVYEEAMWWHNSTCTPPISGNWTLDLNNNCSYSSETINIDYLTFENSGDMVFTDSTLLIKGITGGLPNNSRIILFNSSYKTLT